jgi:ubiquinone/menaquinone biosynthesis C-methylase UbiE
MRPSIGSKSVDAAQDFTSITELPGSHLNRQQMARIRQRYALGSSLAEGKRVLEVSCGAGVGFGLLERAAAQVVGCDLTFGVLATAQRHYGERIPLAGADAQSLPFAARTFDLLLLFEAIYYLPRPDAFLREAHRILSPVGTLLIGTSNPGWPHFVPGKMSIRYPGVPLLADWLQLAGFQTPHFYGSLATPTRISPGQAVVAAARRQMVRLPLFGSDTVITRLLKRLVYGRLAPLPPELPTEPAKPTAEHGLTTISSSQPDRIHRVLFVLAQT